MSSSSAASATRANKGWKAPCDVLVQCRSPRAATRTTWSGIGRKKLFKRHANFGCVQLSWSLEQSSPSDAKRPLASGRVRAVARSRRGGERDDRNVTGAGLFPKVSGRRPVVDVRHRQVHHDDVRTPSRGLLDPAGTVTRGDDAASHGAQIFPVDHTGIAIVVDDEDKGSAARSFARSVRCWVCRQRDRGFCLHFTHISRFTWRRG